jgi:hypothetical protein
MLDPARLLIEDYFELKTLTTDIEHWTDDDLNSNPPRYYRFLRIKACLKALQINSEKIKEFELGQFNTELSEERISQLYTKLGDSFNLETESYILPDDKKVISPSFIFNMLLKTRLLTHRFSSLCNGVMAASGHFLTPVLVLEHIENKLKDEQVALDNALVFLLNPETILFEYSELVEKYGFPDVDIDEIDDDYA